MPFLARLAPGLQAELMGEGIRRRYPVGAVMLRQGDPSDHILLIADGLTKISRVAPTGHEALLGLRGAGEVVGEMSALDGVVRSASATALRQVECVAIRATSFRSFLLRHPETALTLLVQLTERLRASDDERVEVGAYPVAKRLARLLLRLSDRYGTPSERGTVIEISLSQRELAGGIGASREAISRLLRDWRDRDVVVTGRLAISVIRPAVLRRIADQT